MNAIVSFAKGLLYENIVKNLIHSLTLHYAGDAYIFKDEAKIPSSLYSELPYAFKPYAFKKLFNISKKCVVYVWNLQQRTVTFR